MLLSRHDTILIVYHKGIVVVKGWIESGNCKQRHCPAVRLSVKVFIHDDDSANLLGFQPRLDLVNLLH